MSILPLIRACWFWPIILPLALILKAHQKAGR